MSHCVRQLQAEYAVPESCDSVRILAPDIDSPLVATVTISLTSHEALAAVNEEHIDLPLVCKVLFF